MPPTDTTTAQGNSEQTGVSDTKTTKKNVYPFVRRILIISLVLFTLSVLIFLIYQNGESLYENGI